MDYARAVNGLKVFVLKPPFRARDLKTRFQPKKGRTYILPTGFGFAFAGMAFILLIMAIGYANNVIYFFVFALISVAFTSMSMTNKNVDRVRILNLYSEALFASQKNNLHLRISNSTSGPSFRLQITLHKKKVAGDIEALLSDQSADIAFEWFAPKRGLVTLDRITLSSDFPFGLLRSWKTYQHPEKLLVYPSRQGRSNYPEQAIENQNQGASGLFRDHRPYQSTDSPRRIDWRASTKHQNLFVKNFETAEKPILQLTWSSVDFVVDFDDKLSQLCLWLCQAEEEGRRYSLELGKFKSEGHQGRDHLKKCLEHLALVQPDELSDGPHG